MRSLISSGSATRTRTWDLVVNSHPLYRLSYRGIGAEKAGAIVPNEHAVMQVFHGRDHDARIAGGFVCAISRCARARGQSRVAERNPGYQTCIHMSPYNENGESATSNGLTRQERFQNNVYA